MDHLGLKDYTTGQSEYNAITFVVQQILNQVQTTTLVKVMGVTNNGDVSPVGFVDVQPMVNLMTADRVGIEHKTIFGVPYLRLQGGRNAIIIDPQVGDIGICCFASRDISAVIKSKKPNNAGSFRKFDWADGLYMGGMLNGTPNQFMRFSAEGIEITSPTAVVINAPSVKLKGATKVEIEAPIIDLKGQVTQTVGTFSIGGVTFNDHVHDDAHGGTTGLPHN